MSKPIPQIQKYMTPMPETIDADETISAANEKMSKKRIRHFPVTKGGRLVGVLSERDVLLIESLDGVSSADVLVGDAMSPNPYSVAPEASIQDVANEMADRKYGSAVVVANGRVVGVFTTTDACRTLAEVWNTRLK